MWLGVLLNKNNPFSSRRNNKSCDIIVYYVPFLWGSFRCNIAATTFLLLHGMFYGLECGLVFVVMT